MSLLLVILLAFGPFLPAPAHEEFVPFVRLDSSQVVDAR